MSANSAGDDEQLGSAPDPNAQLKSVNPLLKKPTGDQLKLLELVWDAFQRHAVWPIYQYVEASLAYEGLNALAILGSFPTVGSPGVQPRYGPVWYQQAGNVAPPPESPVKLTIAGLQHVPDGPDAIRTFLKVLCSMVACLRATCFSPTTLVEAVITRDR